MEHFGHIIHAMGEMDHHVATVANTLFAISLIHGGQHWTRAQIRRRRMERLRRTHDSALPH